MSRWKTFCKLVFLAVLVVGGSTRSDARSFRVSQLPSGSVKSCANCHTSARGGGPRNAFGLEVQNNFLTQSGFGGQLVWNLRLAQLDSDGDGVPNGIELGDPDGDGTVDPSLPVTNPGDATDFAQTTQPPVDNGGDGGTQPPADGPISVVSLHFGGVTIEEDIKNPVVPFGTQEGVFVFSQPLDFTLDEDGDPDFGNVEFVAIPPSLFEVAGLPVVSDDGLTLTASFDLPEGETYQVIIGDSEAESINDLQVFFFGTTDLSDATVSGTALLPEGLGEAKIEEEGIALLLDPQILFEVFRNEDDPREDGSGRAGKIAGLKRAAKAALLQQQRQTGDGQTDPNQDGGGRENDGDEDGDDGGLGELIRPAVRLAALDNDLNFSLDYVPDGEYVLAVALDVRTGDGPVSLVAFLGINEDAENEEEAFQDLVVVDGGQSVGGLKVQLREDLDDVFIEQVTVARVEPENNLFFIRGRDDLRVVVDVSDAVLYTFEGESLDIDDLLPGDVVQIVGLAGNEGLIAQEVIALRHQAPPKVTGIVLDVQVRDDRGRIDMTGPSFTIDANTRVVGSRGGALTARDLRVGNQVVILARQVEEMGRPPVAVEVRVQSAGSPLPSPDSERGLFVGELGNVDVENKRLTLRVSFGLNRETRLIDREGNRVDLAVISKGARVQITALPTDVGTAFARTIRVLRAAGEQVAERITEAVFVTPEGEVAANRAFAVPLAAELRLRFDVPLTDATKDLVEIFVYESTDDDEGGEDVAVATEVVNGELKAMMTLEPDTFYEVFAAIDNGNEFFGIFTTALALPTLQAVSSSPANGDVSVALNTTLSVTLNQPLASDGFEVFAYIEILPRPLSGEIEPQDLILSDDGMTISVAVELEPDRTYLATLVEAYDVNGFELDHIYKARFSTGSVLSDGKVTGNFVLPAGQRLDPASRNGIGFVGLISTDLDFENLDGDEAQLGTAFDITRSGEFSIEGVPAGSYVVEGVAFFESGGDGGEGLGLVGSYVDQNGDPIIIEVGEAAEVAGIEVLLGSELDLRASSPRPGQGGVGSGRQTLSLEFSEPLQQHRGQLALDVEMIPAIAGFDPRKHLRINRDNPRQIEAKVNFEPNTDYVLLVLWAQGVSGAELDDVIEIPFSTRERFLGGSIGGSLTLSDGSTARGEVTLGNLRNQKRAGEVNIRRDGSFLFKNVPPGEYGIYVTLQLADGRQIRSFLDRDGDDEPDVLALAADDNIADLEFAVTIPIASIPPTPGTDGENANATLSFDFGSATGNDGISAGQVTSGEVFSVGVYASGVANLIGYEIVVAYDAEKVGLKSVQEQTSAEGVNVLKTSGGLGAFIGRIGEGTATLSAVILGPSEKVAPDGNGLVGVLEFEALDAVTGETELTIQSAVLTDINSISDSLSSESKGLISGVELTKVLGVTIEPSIIKADGIDNATITCQVLDINSVLQSDDNSTVVTFAASGGNLGSTTVTAVNGVATTTLVSGTAGTITVTASVSGAVDQTAKVVAQATSTEVSTGPAGPVALDLDLTKGDQGTRQSATTPSVGDVVEVDLVAVSGALDAVGVNLVLSFDSSALSFKGFAATDIFTGALPITVPGSGSVQISLALLGTSATNDAGSIGTASFTVESGFGGSARVVLTSAEYATSSGIQVLDIGAGGATILFGGDAGSGPSPDLNGDGNVGFPDFLIFAQAFGQSKGDAGYNASADLNSDGNIGFPDFLIFAQAFGQPVSSKIGRLSKPVGF